MRITFLLMNILIILASCKSLKVSKVDSEIFHILNKITYQHNEITDEDNAYHSIAEYLNKQEIAKLKTWKNQESGLDFFDIADCIGCSNDFSKFKPLYKAGKGNFIHFGLKKSNGIENLVFTNKGKFLTHFFIYKGVSPFQIEEELNKRGKREYIINSIFPTNIDVHEIYLKHLEYSDENNNGEWYNTKFPMEVEYYINVKEKQPILRFKFKGGYYSSQNYDLNGDLRIIHFFEPAFVENKIGLNQQSSFSTKAKGYYGEATFFLIKLEEKMNLNLVINSKVIGKTFQFSVLESNSFKTIDQFVNTPSEFYTSYNENLDKGEYLVRVINGGSTPWDRPLYVLNLKKVKL